jgi:hypothetical protein
MTAPASCVLDIRFPACTLPVRSLATFMQPRRIPYPCCAPSCSAASPGARRPEALAQGISGRGVVPRNRRIAAQGHFRSSRGVPYHDGGVGLFMRGKLPPAISWLSPFARRDAVRIGLSHRRPSTDADITPAFTHTAERCSFSESRQQNSIKGEASINLQWRDFCPICRPETPSCSHFRKHCGNFDPCSPHSAPEL